jgi:hypothetical protein
MKHILFFLLLVVVVFGQDNPPMPPHRSGITPPLIMGNMPLVRHHPRNTYDLYLPEGKEPEPLLSLANMSIDELLERVRTNRENIYLLQLMDTRPRLKTMIVTPEDELVLSNYHQPKPQHP